jgi:hypothetical protein
MGRQNVGVEVEVVKSVVPIGARVGNPISGGIGRCGW